MQKKIKSMKDPYVPKKPMSAYNLYLKDVKDKDPQLPFSDI